MQIEPNGTAFPSERKLDVEHEFQSGGLAFSLSIPVMSIRPITLVQCEWLNLLARGCSRQPVLLPGVRGGFFGVMLAHVFSQSPVRGFADSHHRL